MNRPTRTPSAGNSAQRDATPRADGAPPAAASLADVHDAVVHCEQCPRLREYCQRIGREKRAAYRNDVYWARPVPGFGNPQARIVLVGLAPAAHGANRTGRMFTGDGSGGSGDFLMTALHATGLASQAFSRTPDDGLALHGTWMTAMVRCAPPDNIPSPGEIANCRPHLQAELAALPRLRVLVALGGLAFTACWRWLAAPGPRPTFGHGVVVRRGDGISLVASYHPSRQNTHTGRLTPDMLRQVCETARMLARE